MKPTGPKLLDQLETQARQRSHSLEARGKLPAGYTQQHYPLTLREQAESRRLRAAMQAASDADTYVALARGDIVPTHRIKQGLLDYHRRRTQHRPPDTGGGV